MKINLPAQLRVEQYVPKSDHLPAFGRILFSFDEDRRRYLPLDLTIHGNNPMLSMDIRSIPYGRLFTEILREELKEENLEFYKAHAPVKAFFDKTIVKTKRRKRPYPTKEEIETTREVYTLARACGAASIWAVALAHGIEHEDAKLWVKIARGSK